MKEFCIAGPIDPKDHYYISHRLNWDELDSFIKSKFYFVLHAPRQSGKTTAIKEYAKHVNEQGLYTALYVSLEPAHIRGATIERSVYWLLHQLLEAIKQQLPDQHDALAYLEKALNQKQIAEGAFLSFLTFWSRNSLKPLVVFFDEVDGLTGEALIAFLKQIRTGFTTRPDNFPQSIGFVGVRDLRDYKVKVERGNGELYTESPFNIKARSLRLADFTLEDVKELYGQHTQATGQVFTPEAIEYAFYLTQGQPWLVNALADQACFRDVTDRSQPITKEIIDRAKNELIARRDTHLDALLDRLNDKRIFPIIDAIISGKQELSFNRDDVQYARDLGLIKPNSFEIANPIYQEIIPRELVFVAQETIPHKMSWYLDSSNQLDMNKLLENFSQFFRENSESFLKNIEYKESAPHLLLMAFLQRIVNGGGVIDREYALGTKRVDLLIIWPRGKQRIVIELKINYGKGTLEKGLQQTAQYMDISHATEGHLMIFDRDPHKSWDEKVKNHIEHFQGKTIHVWWL